MMVLTRILLQISFARQCSKSQLSHLLCHLCLYCCYCRRRSGFLLRLLYSVSFKVGFSQLGPLQNCPSSINSPAQTCERYGQMRCGRYYCLERASCFSHRMSCCHFLSLPFSHGISRHHLVNANQTSRLLPEFITRPLLPDIILFSLIISFALPDIRHGVIADHLLPVPPQETRAESFLLNFSIT